MAPSWKIASSSDRPSPSDEESRAILPALQEPYIVVPSQDRQLFLPPSPLNNSMRVLINVYNSIFHSRNLHERRSCRIDFLLSERRREREGGRKKERKGKKGKKFPFLEESCSSRSSSSSIIVLFPTSNVSLVEIRIKRRASRDAEE